ncbi:MAG TPA: hypothetical protein PLD59_06205 [Tepidisphaeraceae bacterium]|nr:hypothetical protein [Tepidisphaeraceae bacterium]
MKKQSKHLTASSFNALTVRQKKAIYDDCEQLSPLTKGVPLSAAQRSQHRRARRRAGRPTVGEGAEKVRISIERGLLRQTDALAAQSDVTRSQVIATALRRLIADAA